jgi:WhiB family transcriptional regulator, redox-sensing transcriptional regulator
MNGEDQNWRARAACAGMSGAAADRVFFPECGSATAAKARVMAVCGGCPVRAECLAERLAYEREHPTRHLFGWWGGVSPEGRRALLKGVAA